MADLQSRVTKAQWRSQVEKLREICHHLRHCRECGETDVMNCPEGRVLWLDQFFEDGREVAQSDAENSGGTEPHDGAHAHGKHLASVASQSDAKVDA